MHCLTGLCACMQVYARIGAFGIARSNRICYKRVQITSLSGLVLL